MKQKSFRVSDETVRRLAALSDLYQKPETQIISDLIHADYDRVQGNPELKNMIAKINELQLAIETFNSMKENSENK